MMGILKHLNTESKEKKHGVKIYHNIGNINYICLDMCKELIVG